MFRLLNILTGIGYFLTAGVVIVAAIQGAAHFVVFGLDSLPLLFLSVLAMLRSAMFLIIGE